MSLSGYRVEERLHTGRRTTVYRAVRLDDERPVIVKRLNLEYPTPRDLAAFRMEFETLGRLARQGVEGVVEPVAFHGQGKDVGMVFAYLPGVALDVAIPQGGMDLRQALRLCADLARTLARVHAAGIVHKDVKPGNVVVDSESGRCWLIDFGIATTLQSEQADGRRLEGSIATMSPEQTGRMNRPVDSRTDLYSLGVTLFQLLSGRLPFEGDDPLELVHAHIALEPPPLATLRPDLPAPVCALVSRLLRKTPDARYQSAEGLAADLEAMADALDRGRLPDEFPLGQHDAPARFSLPSRLYGREEEVSQLLDTFERAAAGASEMLFVSGWSGIGKSALIHEVQKPIVRQRGYFIEGKFDQFKRNIPYASLIQAFGDLVAQLSTESTARIAHHRDAVLDALGNIAGVATDVLPELELIIGPQPPVPELSGEAAQNRLNRTFRELVKVFARPEHPLVLFLDDLQWADQPTLDLLRILVTDADLGHLLVIGCYRDNEVDEHHPLALTLAAVAEQRQEAGLGPMADLHLGGLSRDTLTELVADCVRTDSADAAPLAGLIHDKTLGNPFFVGQFLRLLHKDGLLQHRAGRWTWDLAEIEARGITDNVVELMTGKLLQLPDQTRAALRLAAAIGNSFTLRVLAAVRGEAPGVVADELWPALDEGYLQPLDDGYRLVSAASTDDLQLDPRYRFLHDRVQQAAYALVPEPERAATHLGIGRAMLALLDDDGVEERLFDLVDQLHHGLELVTDPAERMRHARLFARAGDKARLASAHPPALKYFEAAVTLLGEGLWTEHYELGQRVVFQQSASEYLVGNFERAEGLFEELVTRSRTDLEKAQVYRLELSLNQSRGLFLETVDIATKGLSQLGVHLPRDPSQLTFFRELIRFKLKMRGRSEQDLKDLPTCTDPVVVTALDIMNDFSGPAFFVDINIYLCVVLKMCSLSLEHGNAAESAYCWTLYGMMNGPIMGNVPHGMELGRVGEHVDAQHRKATLIPKVALSLGGLVYQWGQHPRLSIPYFERGFQAALESGDPTHAGYCANFTVCMYSVIGEPLPRLEEATRRFWSFARKNRIEVQSEIQIVERQFARCLMGRTASPESWDDDDFDEAEWLERARGFQSRQPLHNYLIEKQASLVMLGRFAEAMPSGDESSTMLDVSLGIPIFSNHHLFRGLCCARLAGLPGHPKARSQLKAMLRQHRKWARHNPDGFEHKRLLLEAELARVQGKADAALALYEQSLEQAAAQGFVHHEALAGELAGRMLVEQGRRRVGLLLLREARHAWQRWGATAVVERLDADFPDLAFARGEGVPAAGGGTLTLTTATTSEGSLDVHAILRASRAVSGEIRLPQLLERLMQLVLESAGARRALLLLHERGGWVVQAEQLAGFEAQVLLEQPLAQRDDLAHGVVNYVIRRREAVVLDDLAQSDTFAKDPYVAAGRTRSLLCAPIVHGGLVAGVIYLENGLVSGAFTPERLELLRLLSAQVAISIENAGHYRRAEQQAAAFARFVPREFLEHLGRHDIVEVGLGDAVQREMTVLFSDIRSFTAISEAMTPSENMAFLNEYLQRVGPVIREHGGFIDKYVGDAVMALFPGEADAAVGAAVAMQHQVAALNKDRADQGLPSIAIGVGLHHGSLMLGTIGEEERMDSTVISDAVNTASRLEGLTKRYGAAVLISAPTLERCTQPGGFGHRWLGTVRLRGRAAATGLYEVFASLPPAQVALREQTREAFEAAVRAKEDGRPDDARAGLEAVLAEDPGDAVAKALCAELGGGGF